jgi:hypothetical protein
MHAGRYVIQPLPPLLDGVMVMGSIPTTFTEPMDLDGNSRHDLGFRVSLNEGGPTILNSENPIDLAPPKLHAESVLAGRVNGTVEHGAAAAVVVLPEQYGAYGELVFCDPDGSFEAKNLVRGFYFVAAFEHLDLEGLRDPEVVRRIVSDGTKIQVKIDPPADLRLKAIPWPE